MAREDLFEKAFILKCHEDSGWELPRIELSSKKYHLQDKTVTELKTALNEVKRSLNSYEIGDWHKHTTYCNPSAVVNRKIRYQFHPELCTQAWCKFHEILCFDQVLPEFALSSKLVVAVHLCEAPGAFVCSLNHYLKSHFKNVQYKWLASSLNPYYEGNDPDSCVADDRLIFRTLNKWCFGPDNTGNIFSKSLLDDLCERASALGTVCLVTADGSFNCQKNPEKQELDTACLKFTEILYGLRILGQEGSLVLKIFVPLEYTSIQILYILCCTFSFVGIRKPATSKPGNSELYIVAKGYKKLNSDHPLMVALEQLCLTKNPCPLELFCTSDLPVDFMTKYRTCVEIFVQHQINAIKYNIRKYGEKDSLDLKEEHEMISAMAIEKMEIMNIPRNQCIIRSGILKRSLNSNVDLRPKMSGTFMDRKIITPAAEVQESTGHTWMSNNPAPYRSSEEFTFGKPLSSIRTSLFCDTAELLALYQSRGIELKKGHYNVPDEFNTIQKSLREMLSYGNGQVYEVDMFANGKVCREILNPEYSELLSGKPLKLSSSLILEKGSLVFASLLKTGYEDGSLREISSAHHFLKLACYILRNCNPGANLMVLLPSVLTRLTGGLLYIILVSFECYSITTSCYSSPCIVVLCKKFTDDRGFRSCLKMSLQHSSELPDDRSLLEIIPITEMLRDEEYIKILKKSNHIIFRALQARKENFVL